jgi:RNA polymerase sigma-70 factor (ECF subfamily)
LEREPGVAMTTHDTTKIVVGPAFDLFYRKEYPAVVGLIYALSGSRWAAEDLAQEAFLRAYRDWDRVRGYAAPGAWVRRVAVNLAMSRFRRIGAEGRALSRLVSRSAHPFEVAASEHDDFWRAVRRLPKRQAQVVALFYLEDRGISDIAQVLGITPDAVKASLHEGRRSLARRLGPMEEGRR